MPLQHSHEHEEPTATPPTTPRYDTATVKQIIALADQMQTHHRQTLTPSDIEALGHEVGVEPEFIRRALAQVEAHAVPTPTVIPKTTATQTVVAAAVRPHHQSALWLATLYMFLAPLTFGGVDDYLDSAASKFLYIGLPLLLALFVGWQTRKLRVGAWVSGLLGSTAVVTLYIQTAAHHHRLPAFAEFAIVLMIWTIVCALIGGVGAVVRQKYP